MSTGRGRGARGRREKAARRGERGESRLRRGVKPRGLKRPTEYYTPANWSRSKCSAGNPINLAVGPRLVFNIIPEFRYGGLIGEPRHCPLRTSPGLYRIPVPQLPQSIVAHRLKQSQRQTSPSPQAAKRQLQAHAVAFRSDVYSEIHRVKYDGLLEILTAIIQMGFMKCSGSSVTSAPAADTRLYVGRLRLSCP